MVTASPRTDINVVATPAPDKVADPNIAYPYRGNFDASSGSRYQVEIQSPLKTTGVAGTTGTTATAAPTCYAAISAGAVGAIRGLVESKAIERWTVLAADQPPYISSWNHAQAKTYDCKREGPTQRWSCVVTAQPCISGSDPIPDPTPACYPARTATGPWRKLQGTAENHARDQWQYEAGNAHGANYKWWNKARNSDISCSHDGKKPAFRQWQCRAVAEPCF
jgi:hypothetical protein